MKISEKRGLLISQIPNVRVYTIKNPLIGRVFLGPKNRPIREVPVFTLQGQCQGQCQGLF